MRIFSPFSLMQSKKKKELLSPIGLLLSKSNGFNSPLLTATVGLVPPGGPGGGLVSSCWTAAELDENQSDSPPSPVEKRGRLVWFFFKEKEGGRLGGRGGRGRK